MRKTWAGCTSSTWEERYLFCLGMCRVSCAEKDLLHKIRERQAERPGDPRQQANVRWIVALDGDEQTTGYRKVEEIRQKVSEAFRLRDEVWSELPLLAEWHFLRRRLTPPLAADQSAAAARASDQLVELMAQSIAR